jgi:hypothetical protein
MGEIVGSERALHSGPGMFKLKPKSLAWDIA